MAAITVRQAHAADARVMQDMLGEAARWVDALGVVMWEEGELAPGRVEREIAAGSVLHRRGRRRSCGHNEVSTGGSTLLARFDHR